MSSTMVTIEIPMRLPSASNLREHHMARYRRVKAQRAATALTMRRSDLTPEWKHFDPGETRIVTLTRIAPRKLDDDNLRGAFKAVRDEVAAYFGVDDADPRIEWRYEQTKGPACVRIRFEVVTAQEVA